MNKVTDRRPLKTRKMRWTGAFTWLLLRYGISANAISIMGIGFAAAGAVCFVYASESRWLWLAAALFIQLRLLANMMDGLVAIEGQRSSATGPLFNELPDRIEDTLLLVTAGMAAGHPMLGWSLAMLAITTAYIRLLGGSLGFAQDFRGPMAKPHRMALLTLGALASAAFPGSLVMTSILGIILLGTAITCLRRLSRIAETLRGAKP